MLRSLKSFLVSSSMALSSIVEVDSAFAVPINWTLSGATFDDSGTASGTFAIDSSTGGILTFDITTTHGTDLDGFHYNATSATAGGGSSSFDLHEIGGDDYYFRLRFNGPLTSYGTRQLLATGDGLGSWECTFCNPTRFALSGYAVSVAQPEPGDYNNNRVVDAADYVLWRKDVTPLTNEVAGVTPNDTTPEDYDAWRARFGNFTPGGAGEALSGQSVPEPSTVLMLIVAAVGICQRRRRAK